MTEGPYKLPKGWRWVRLGEVATDIQTGFAFRKKGADKGDVVHLRPYNIGDDGELALSKQFLIPGDALPKGWSELQPGDVLFNNTNSVELVGKTALVRTTLKAAFSNHITRIRTNHQECVGAWLALSLNALRLQGFFRQRCNKWIGQAGYNTEALRDTPIPLPPLEEQRRIVARVEELMARVREARRLREQAREDAERLWQAVLAETFPRPGSDLPAGWRWVQLGEVCQHRTGIWGPEASDPAQGFPIVRSTEIDGFFIRPHAASVRVVRPGQVDAYKLETGDILVSKSSGSPHLVGWPAIFENPQDGRIYLFSNFMLRLRSDRRSLEPWFLLYYLHSPIARSIYLSAQDTTSGLRNLRVQEFMAQPIPLPPLDEQRRIVAYLQAVQEKVKPLKEAQAQTDEDLRGLERAILDRAFRGEL